MTKLFISLIAVALMVVGLTPARAETLQETVRDENAQIVTTKTGNCVRTKWQGPDDICAPKPVPVVQAPPPPPPPQIALEQRTIYFDFNKDSITGESAQKLDALAAIVQSSPSIKRANVVGYTDEIGSDSYNQKLSEHRAYAVRDYLAHRISIPTDVAEIRGLGKSYTATCKQKNRKERISCLAPDRRVEVEFTYQK